MKEIISYECESCGMRFESKEDCEAHENKFHRKIDWDSFMKLVEKLNISPASLAGMICGSTNCIDCPYNSVIENCTEKLADYFTK